LIFARGERVDALHHQRTHRHTEANEASDLHVHTLQFMP